MKKHLLVLLLGLSIIYGAAFGWAYFIDGANAKWYAFPISVIFFNVFLVGFPIALAGYEAVRRELKSAKDCGP